MKRTALAIALLISGTAIAQTQTDMDVDVSADTSMQRDGDELDVNADVDTRMQTDSTMDHDMMDHSTTVDSTATVATDTSASTHSTTVSTHQMTGHQMASAMVVQPGNTNKERDARGVAVTSDAAVVPIGWNGVSGTAVGGPLVDPVSGETIDADNASYPPCTATVTDNCLQTYERGRSD